MAFEEMFNAMKDQFTAKIGIALSGGGARGMAHIGVLRALLELGMEPEIVSGASAGSIVGALYAAGLPPSRMREFVESASLLRAIKPGMSTKGLISLSYLRQHLAEYISEDSFEALRLPLSIAVCNLHSGKTEIVESGKLFEAVMASSAIPLVFNPVEMNGQMYVDGGLLTNLPARALRPRCQVLIGVNLMPEVELPPGKFKGMMSWAAIATRCFQLSVVQNSRADLEVCDHVIEPDGIDRYHVFQFGKLDELEEIGYRTTMAMASQLSGSSF